MDPTCSGGRALWNLFQAPLDTDAEPSTDAELRAHAKEDPQALNRLGWQKIQAKAKGEERDIDLRHCDDPSSCRSEAMPRPFTTLP